MKRVTSLVCGAVLCLTASAFAQEEETRGFLSPVFVAQPGFVTTNFIDKDPGTSTNTDFNIRFVTVLPLEIPRTVIVGIVQWLPFADNAAGGKANSPSFVYGPIVNIFNTKAAALDFDALFSYGPAATGNSDYTHKFLFEADFYLKIGSLANARGQLANLSLYALYAYVLTGLPDGVDFGDRSVLLYGLSLPIAPWKVAR